MNSLGPSKSYMAAVSPGFYTHYGVNSWNKVRLPSSLSRSSATEDDADLVRFDCIELDLPIGRLALRLPMGGPHC
jgi:hypothetical protein